MYKKVTLKLFLIIGMILIFVIYKFTNYNAHYRYISNKKSEFLIGVNIHFLKPNIKEIDKLQGAGFKVVRMDLTWRDIEKRRGSYDFSQYDKLVESMRARHIKILFILDYDNHLYDKGFSPYSDKGRMAFANFAKQAVNHYKGEQIIWEIWNEPDGTTWKPKPDAYVYSMLVINTIKAIRKEDKNAFIIAPALSGFDYTYLQSLGENGIFQYINAISIHPYRTSNPETVINDYSVLRKSIDKYPHYKNIQIFSGEWGYSTSWNGMNDMKQAQYCIREYLTNIMSGVNLSIWYDWRDDGNNKSNQEYNFGTVDSKLNPKPTYYAIKTMNETINGYKYVKRISLQSNDDYMLMFQKGDKVVYAIWTTGKAHNININLKNNNIQIIELTGKNYNVKVSNKSYNINIDNSVKYIIS